MIHQSTFLSSSLPDDELPALDPPEGLLMTVTLNIFDSFALFLDINAVSVTFVFALACLLTFPSFVIIKGLLEDQVMM
jgi:hypothetical protein